jgi:arylsulfatase A-like enzyme/Tfp pilus assembly protein PilF
MPSRDTARRIVPKAARPRTDTPFASARLLPSISALLLLVAMAGCGDHSAPPGEIRNVLLISIDTCRADHLSCYGAPRKTTPNLDQLAAEGTLFENAFSPAPITLPAHASMLTGTDPPYHAVHDNTGYRLGPANETLAELLGDRGFVTGAVIGAFVLDSRFGLDQGFQTYDDRFDSVLKETSIAHRRGEEVSRHALSWLEEHYRKPFFLFLHYFDPHFAYDPPGPFRSAFADDLYAGEIAYADHCIGQVIEALQRLGVYDSTLIIVTSDHGEMLGEHGEGTHSYFVYQSAIRVPLIVRVPGSLNSRRVAESVGLIDLLPTVCGLLGFQPPRDVQGIDLSPTLTGGISPAAERSFYCESMVPATYGCNPLLGLVRGRWKYILTTRAELYDLAHDYQELENLAATRADERLAMDAELREILNKYARESSREERIDLDEKALQSLRALGYVGRTATSPDLAIDPDRDDPKDLIDFHLLNMAVYEQNDEWQATRGTELAERMIAERPDLPSGYLHLADLALAESDLAKALPHLIRASELDPGDAMIWFRLGRAYGELGESRQAIEQYERALELDPHNIETHNNLGIALQAAGRVEPAIEQYWMALKLDPDNVEAHNNLANAMAAADRIDEAISHYRRTVELAPDSAEVHANLGLALRRRGLLDEAIEQFELSLQLAPEGANARAALAAVLLSIGRPTEAAEHYRRALELEPGSASLHNNMANALAAQGAFEEAAEQYRAALRLEPGYAQAHFNLGLTLRARNKPDEAIAQFRRVLEIDPDHAKARRHLQQLLRARDSR